MRQPLTAALLAATLALLLPPVGARGQGAPAPAAQPVTQPAQPTSAGSPNPLRSPAHMLDYFRAALIDAERQPQRLTDAAACLDFSEVDPEVVKEKGQEYALQLGAIVAHLVAGMQVGQLLGDLLAALALTEARGEIPVDLVRLEGLPFHWQQRIRQRGRRLT
jgi:hypothetical protein